MKDYRNAIIAILLVLLLFFLSSCGSNAGIMVDTTIAIKGPYGFWGGLWHGIIIPVTWIGSMFSDNVAIYAINNNGNWYDFGFAIGVGGIIFGSGSSKK